MNALEVLTDMATRPREAAFELREHLSEELLNAHPGGHANSIAWLLWHTGREMDAQLAHLSGQVEVWEQYRDIFALGEVGDGIGYGHTPEQARSIVARDANALLDYIAAVTDALVAYIGTLDDASLDEIIDTNWTPHVTRGVRLVSVVDDAAQHVAQAAYIVGMPR